MTDDDIARWVAAARLGDVPATDHILRHVYDGVWRVTRRMMGNDHDAADVTQNALIAIVAGLPRFDGRSALSTWCYRIASNACLDEMRRRSRRPHPAELPETWTDRSADPSAEVSDRVDIDSALQHLSEDHRRIFILREMAGMDYAELAEHLDIPVGTVRSRLARARGQLAGILDEGNQTPDPIVERGDHG